MTVSWGMLPEALDTRERTCPADREQLGVWVRPPRGENGGASAVPGETPGFRVAFAGWGSSRWRSGRCYSATFPVLSHRASLWRPSLTAGAGPAGVSPATSDSLSPAQIRGAYGISQLPADRERRRADHRHRRRLRRSVTGQQHKSELLCPATCTRSTPHYGLADPPSFLKLDENGGTNYPAGNSGWGEEESLDVEWAHSIAPQRQYHPLRGGQRFSTPI